MYTCCPNCAAVFRVSAALLGQAGGRARCGDCREVFSVVDALYEDLVSAREAALEVRRTEPQPPLADVAEVREQVPVIPTYYQDDWRPRTFSGRDLLSVISIALLSLLLGLQWAWFNRDAVASNADWRPLLEEFCAVAHCELPMRSDLSQLAIIDRDVRQHPVVSEALLINAEFQNQADFVQPYPLFEVSFIDSSGRPVAVRRFRPAEYMSEGVDITAGMAAQAPVQVVLEVMDPGETAVSFQFDFL